LATKLHVPPPSKKQKELKEVKETKKKGSTSSKSVAAPKARASAEKKPKRASSRKVGGAGSSRARRSPSLPRVVEEAEGAQGHDGERLTQAVVDARCYELTVLPLADVSQAYEQAPALDEQLVGGSTEDSKSDDTAKEQSTPVESEKTKVERASSLAPPSSEVSSSTPDLTREDASAFSTPDRKRIYTAFTFSSPSPTSIRFAAARASSVERFSDIALQS